MESRRWAAFCALDERAGREVLAELAVYGDPLLIFWLDSDTWTVLTNQFLVGKLRGVSCAVALDELCDVTTDNETNSPPEQLKRRAQILRAGADRLAFWTPAGNEHFSIRNILGMFPIRAP